MKKLSSKILVNIIIVNSIVCFVMFAVNWYVYHLIMPYLYTNTTVFTSGSQSSDYLVISQIVSKILMYIRNFYIPVGVFVYMMTFIELLKRVVKKLGI